MDEKKTWTNDFSKEIFYHIIEFDRLTLISLFGKECTKKLKLISKEVLIKNRIGAIERMPNILKMMIEDIESLFSKESKKKINSLKSQIEEVIKYLPAIKEEGYNKKTIEINEHNFKLCLKELRKIKDKIIKLMSKGCLLFPVANKNTIIDLKKAVKKIK